MDEEGVGVSIHYFGTYQRFGGGGEWGEGRWKSLAGRDLSSISSAHRSKGRNVLRTFVRGHIVMTSSVQTSENTDRRNNERQFTILYDLVKTFA